MTHQIFATPVINGNALVPAAEELHYDFNEQGQPQHGGYCIIGKIEADMATVLVRIEATPEKHLELEANLDYLQVEEL